eukprot:EG_transcript_296
MVEDEEEDDEIEEIPVVPRAKRPRPPDIDLCSASSGEDGPPPASPTPLTPPQRLQKRVFLPRDVDPRAVYDAFQERLELFSLKYPDIDYEARGPQTGVEEDGPLHVCLYGFDPAAVLAAYGRLRALMRELAGEPAPSLGTQPSMQPVTPLVDAADLSLERAPAIPSRTARPEYYEDLIPPQVTQDALQGMATAAPPPGWARAQVIALQDERGFGVVRTEAGHELHFRVRAVLDGAFLCRGDLVEVEVGAQEQGSTTRAVRLAQESFLQHYPPDLLEQFLRRVAHAPLRNTLVLVTQRGDSWGALLNTPMPSDGSGLRPRQALALVEFALRVSRCRMATACRTFFRSFVEYPMFVQRTLPKLIGSKHLTDSFLQQLAQFGAALKRFAGAVEGLAVCKLWVQYLRKGDGGASGGGDAGLRSKVIAELLSSRTECAGDAADALPPDPYQNLVAATDSLPLHSDFRCPDRFNPHNLPIVQAQGPYLNGIHYCRDHYQLMQAECFSELVHCINYKYFASQDELNRIPERVRDNILRSVRFYSRVHLAGITTVSGQGGLCYTVLFRSERHDQVRWEATRVLERGALLVFTTDTFCARLWWAVVADRCPALLKAGLVSVRFLRGDPVELQQCIAQNVRCGREDDTVMAEAGVFFTAFHPVLESLHELLQCEVPRLPFQHALVYGRADAVPPGYLTSPARCERLHALVQAALQAHAFDAGQRRAVGQLLQRDFILVQGPPGTGKSFTGVKMGQILAQFRGELLAEVRRTSHAALGLLDASVAAAAHAARCAADAYHGAEQRKADLKQRLQTLKQEKMHHGPLYKRTLRELEALRGQLQTAHRAMLQAERRRQQLSGQRGRRQAEVQHEGAVWAEDFGPIVVVTYKNHSLDEFLLDMLRWLEGRDGAASGLEGVVRIGSRSRCRQLADYNLRELCHRELLKSPAYHQRLRVQLREAVGRLHRLAQEIVQDADVTPQLMRASVTPEQAERFGPIDAPSLQRWLAHSVENGPLQLARLYGELLGTLRTTAEQYQQEMAATVPGGREAAGQEDHSEDEGVARRHPGRRGGRPESTQRDFWETFSPLLPDMPHPVITEEDRQADLWSLSLPDRHALVERWLNTHHQPRLQAYQRAKADFVELDQQMRELMNQVRQDVLTRANLVGITTTGAAIHRDLLQALRPSVMIVEEAAEILEAQLLSCLANIPVQQIILIGDHKQLKPVVQCYQHSQYNRLDLSMFERMEANGVPCIQLTTQRRMTPQLCQFAMPVYPNQLQNDPSVRTRLLVTAQGGRCLAAGQTIPGMVKSIFFWDHAAPEERSPVGRSWVNRREVAMVTAVAHYLLTVGGLQRDQLTVLTPYKGQMKELRRVCGQGTSLDLTNILTVDRYQGDENDVVLLSLVRAQHLTEFIMRQDRMVVALSRARHAMYVMGCASLFRRNANKVPHWMTALQEFEQPSVPFTGSVAVPPDQTPNIGPAFPVCCPQHPDHTHVVSPIELDSDPTALNTPHCPRCLPHSALFTRLPPPAPTPPPAPLILRPGPAPAEDRAGDEDDVFYVADSDED